MSDENENLERFGREIAEHARGFIAQVRDVAHRTPGDPADGGGDGTVLAELLVSLGQLSMAGALLGAVRDVVPAERFPPEVGPEADADPLREALASLLAGLDDYALLPDPLLPEAPVRGSISDDVAEAAVALEHGLRYYESGRLDEALWWWQYTYLSQWGDAILSAQRALLSILSHERLDADADEVTGAEADALLRPE